VFPNGQKTANTTENLLLYPPDLVLYVGMIFLRVLENKEEKLILFGQTATLANLNHKLDSPMVLFPVVCLSGRDRLVVCFPARPALSCVILSRCLDASDMQVLLAH